MAPKRRRAEKNEAVFTAETLHETLTRVASIQKSRLRGEDHIPLSSDQSFKALADGLEFLRKFEILRTGQAQHLAGISRRLAVTLGKLESQLPEILKEYASTEARFASQGIRWQENEAFDLLRSQSESLRLLAKGIEAARLNGLLSAAPTTPDLKRWHGIAPQVEAMFHALLPIANKDLCFGFIAAVVPNLTGETATAAAVDTFLKRPFRAHAKAQREATARERRRLREAKLAIETDD